MQHQLRVNAEQEKGKKFQCSRYSWASRLKPFFKVSPYFSTGHILQHGLIYRLWNWSPSSSPPLPALGCLCRWIFLQSRQNFFSNEFVEVMSARWVAAKVILLFDNWGNLPLLLLTVDFLRIFSTERLLAFARLEGPRFVGAADYYYCYHLLSLLGDFVGQQHQFQSGSQIKYSTLSSLSRYPWD